MEKVIKIGNKEKTFKATAATPIKYRRAVPGGDFFRDLNELKEIDINNLSDMEIEQIEKFAFAMSTDANEANMTFEKWLDQFELFELIKAIPEILSLVMGNIETQNLSNSKNTEPAES